MAAGAQLTITELRRAARHTVDFPVIGEHRQLGDLHLRIINLSAQGFLCAGPMPLGRGERLVVRLPIVGRIEAHLIWSTDDRAGFQFERVLRVDDSIAMIERLQPDSRLRPRR